jgi:hypothetical protein
MHKDTQSDRDVFGKGEEVGLEWAATEAPSEVMRELARIAVAKGFSLGELARRLNKQDGTSLTAVNVSRHFDSVSPRTPTLESYAKVLGVSKAYLGLLERRPPGSPDVKAALLGAARLLLLRGAEFKKGAVESACARVNDLVQQSDTAEAAELARTVILAEQRAQHGINDENSAAHPDFAARFGPLLTAFAAAVSPRIDLFSAALKNADMRLARVWIELGWLFRGDAVQDLDQVIAFIVGLLRRRGVKTSKMEEALERTRRYMPAALELPAGIGYSINDDDDSSSKKTSRKKRDRGPIAK